MGFEDAGTELRGADELDIVYSGLEEIMCNAVKENWTFAVKRQLSFRDACFVNAINKVYNSYKETGIMI
jgi:glutamate dehydrogenase/leucine dehydrogenase